MRRSATLPASCVLLVLLAVSCVNPDEKINSETIFRLKRGELVSCGRESASFGNINFQVTIEDKLKPDFNTAVSLLHSFEYDEAEKMFAGIIDRAPDCAMAYWGVAMANFHPLWAAPDSAELEKGAMAVRLARAQKSMTRRETDYINAVAQFYDSSATLDHRTRVGKFEQAMQQVHAAYPAEVDASVFYALALNAAADPKDKTYLRQKKAFAILSPLFAKQPLHPGVAHLIIHNCDYPALAYMGLDAARKYASIAPASAHAQHMPSHIFTRLGYWNECIGSNQVAAASAVCYAEQAGIKGHWDEELHALDYLVYAYLQQGDNKHAGEQVAYIEKMEVVTPANFKTAHAFAAIPARYALENKNWSAAAKLPLLKAAGDWSKYPWQQGIVRLARILGMTHTQQLTAAIAELDTLENLHAGLAASPSKKNEAALLLVQVTTAKAWISFAKGDIKGALSDMETAADLEDGMDKHPVTPGEVLPARELYADMLVQTGNSTAAFHQYEAVLTTHANRFNALYGAAVAAEKNNDLVNAGKYFSQLIAIAAGSDRKEIGEAKKYTARR
ncbi:MAG: hypothetical protein EOO05_15755 [Chitinophagaceae bacterium]|nr:MAG: hypothetical protein EOO05_15755 [Chitinophagaceae bacterium]